MSIILSGQRFAPLREVILTTASLACVKFASLNFACLAHLLLPTVSLHFSASPDCANIFFDCMLICQAIANQAVIITPDPLIAQHPVSVQW